MTKIFRAKPRELDYHKVRIAFGKGAQRVLHLPYEVLRGTPVRVLLSGPFEDYSYRNISPSTYKIDLRIREHDYDVRASLRPDRDRDSIPQEEVDAYLHSFSQNTFTPFLRTTAILLQGALNKTPQPKQWCTYPVYQPEGIWEPTRPRINEFATLHARATIPKIAPQPAIEILVSRYFSTRDERDEFAIEYKPVPRDFY